MEKVEIKQEEPQRFRLNIAEGKHVFLELHGLTITKQHVNLVKMLLQTTLLPATRSEEDCTIVNTAASKETVQVGVNPILTLTHPLSADEYAHYMDLVQARMLTPEQEVKLKEYRRRLLK